MEKKLMKAHIIPKCFQNAVKDNANEMLVVRLSEGTIQKANDFLFDKNLLCKECDNSFSADENYTAKILNGIRSGEISPVQTSFTNGRQDKFYRIDQYRVKRCLLSILWRMSISKKDYFKSVELGPLENELKSRLNAESLMDPMFIPLSIVSLKSTNNWKSRMLCVDSPPIKYLGCRLYILHIPGFFIIYHSSKQVMFNPKNLSFRDTGFINIGEETKGNIDSYLNGYYKSFPTSD